MNIEDEIKKLEKHNCKIAGAYSIPDKLDAISDCVCGVLCKYKDEFDDDEREVLCQENCPLDRLV